MQEFQQNEFGRTILPRRAPKVYASGRNANAWTESLKCFNAIISFFNLDVVARVKSESSKLGV